MDYSFYTIIPDGFKYGQTTDLTKYPMIIDSGTTMLYLPSSQYQPCHLGHYCYRC